MNVVTFYIADCSASTSLLMFLFSVNAFNNGGYKGDEKEPGSVQNKNQLLTVPSNNNLGSASRSGSVSLQNANIRPNSEYESDPDNNERFKYVEWSDEGHTSVQFRGAPFGGIRKSPSSSGSYDPARL